MGHREKIVVGLDIGSTKVCTLVGAVRDAGLEPIGFGVAESKGLKRGSIVLCEDSTDFNYLRLLSKEGELRDFARNEIAGRTNEEFAGATFSPNGETLFVNIQANRGMTFAIWGPWARLGV